MLLVESNVIAFRHLNRLDDWMDLGWLRVKIKAKGIYIYGKRDLIYIYIYIEQNVFDECDEYDAHATWLLTLHQCIIICIPIVLDIYLKIYIKYISTKCTQKASKIIENNYTLILFFICVYIFFFVFIFITLYEYRAFFKEKKINLLRKFF